MGKVIEIGNKIEMVELAKSASGGEKITYVSQLLSFDEDDEDILKIAMPSHEGKLIPLQVGKRFGLTFYSGANLYMADCVIENRYRQDNIYTLEVRLTTDLKKYQRRQFYRMNCNYVLKFKEVEEEEYEEIELPRKIPQSLLDRPFMEGVSLDISGGGVRLVSKVRISENSKIFMDIDFTVGEEKRTVEAVGNIISSVSSKVKSDIYEMRVSFCDISERDREFIIKYIFGEELKKRQKKESR